MGLFKLYFSSQIFFLLFPLPSSFLKFPYSTYDVLLYWNEVFLLQRLLIQPWDCVEDAKKNLLSVCLRLHGITKLSFTSRASLKNVLGKIFRFDTFKLHFTLNWKTCHAQITFTMGMISKLRKNMRYLLWCSCGPDSEAIEARWLLASKCSGSVDLSCSCFHCS